MERNLVLGALALGCLGWLCLLLLILSRRSQTDATASGSPSPTLLRSSFQWLTVVLPIVIWLATLPTYHPFSSGQGWGRGFLMGGLVASATIFLLSRALASGYSLRVASLAPLFGSLAVACIPLLWMRSAVIDALMGAAIGWVAVTFVAMMALSPQTSEAESKRALEPAPLLLLNGAAFASTLFAVAALGVYRDFVIASVPRGTYSAVAVAIAASLGLTLLFSGILGEAISANRLPPIPRNIAFLSTAITVVLWVLAPLGLASLLAHKIFDDQGVVYVVGLGIILGFFLWWLVWDELTRTPFAAETSGRNRLLNIPVAAVLVALCGFMMAYQLMQGFGVGLMALATWPVSLFLLPLSNETVSSEATGTANQSVLARFNAVHLLSILLSFETVLLLSRLFATRFRADLRGATFSDQFALFGFLVGAAIPALLAALWTAPSEAPDAPPRTLLRALPPPASLPRLICVGLLALALPGGMVALWGIKILPAFFGGLALAAAGFYPNLATRWQTSVATLSSLALGLAVTQWAHHFLPLAEASRSQRLHLLLWTLGLLVIVVLVVDYGTRLVLWQRHRKEQGVLSQ